MSETGTVHNVYFKKFLRGNTNTTHLTKKGGGDMSETSLGGERGGERERRNQTFKKQSKYKLVYRL